MKKTKIISLKTGASLAVMALLLATPIASASAGSSAESDASAGASAGSTAVGGSQGQGQGQAVDLRFDGTKIPKPAARAPSIAAPGLVASMTNSCLGSKSNGFTAGIVGIAAGVTSGKTVQDPPCNARMDAKIWFSFGKLPIAIARLCQQPDNRAAAMAAGIPCPQDVAELIKEKDESLSWLQRNRHTASLQTALLIQPARAN